MAIAYWAVLPVENSDWLPILERADSNSGVLQSQRTCNGKEHNLPLVR
jgi:hypothetical protein